MMCPQSGGPPVGMALGRSLYAHALARCVWGVFDQIGGKDRRPHYGRGDGLLPAGLRGPERCARMGA